MAKKRLTLGALADIVWRLHTAYDFGDDPTDRDNFIDPKDLVPSWGWDELDKEEVQTEVLDWLVYMTGAERSVCEEVKNKVYAMNDRWVTDERDRVEYTKEWARDIRNSLKKK